MRTWIQGLFIFGLLFSQTVSATTSIGVGLNGAISNCRLMGGHVDNPYYDCTANSNGTYVCQCDMSANGPAPGPTTCPGSTTSSVGAGLNAAISNCEIAGGRVYNPTYDCTANRNGVYVCICCTR